MDFSFTEEQIAWQMKARKFAEEEIRPVSLARDAIADPAETIDWELIKKGSKLGFRTAVVAKDQGGHGIDYVTQATVMAELARGDSAASKTFSQCWKWSHLIAAACTDEQKERFLKPFLEDDTFVLGSGQTEANSGSDNRLPPPGGDPRVGMRLRAERDGDYWVLNGEKQFIAHGNVAKLFFLHVRTDFSVPFADGTTILLTTHYLEEAERVCDSIAIIHDGELVANETTKTLIRRLDRKTVTIAITEDLDVVPEALARFDAELLPVRRLAIHYRPSHTEIGEVLAAINGAGLTIADLTTEESDLEDVFLALTSRRGRQA